MYKKYSAKKIIYFVVFILLLGVFSGCSNPNVVNNKEDSASSKAASFSKINPEEAKKRLSNEQGIILLDVRTKEEYDTGHIKDAMLIPVDNLEEDALKNLKDKEAPIFVYCRSGNRSISAANILVELGYKNVYNLGGLRDWPYEVIK
jgi:rhodanese-related sulfurtransferase